MSELVRVAVDAMGGDHAPEAVVQGVVDALNVSKEIEVLLVGDQTAIEKCLKQPGCWLRSSHSLKEFVIDHWSSDSARKI